MVLVQQEIMRDYVANIRIGGKYHLGCLTTKNQINTKSIFLFFKKPLGREEKHAKHKRTTQGVPLGRGKMENKTQTKW